MKIPVKFSGPENPAHEDINSHSEDGIFISSEGLGPDELRCLVRDAVHAVASGCHAAGAKDVSHVKAFLEYSTGFLHADTVGSGEQITVAGRDGGRTKRFRLVINAVIFGLSEQSIRKASEQGIETIQVQYGLTREPAQGKHH